jgi:hypothetical protein
VCARPSFTPIQNIIFFLNGLDRLTCSDIAGSTISVPWRFVFDGVFRQSGVVQSFKVPDPVLFVFESRGLYFRDL